VSTRTLGVRADRARHRRRKRGCQLRDRDRCSPAARRIDFICHAG